MSRVWFKDRFKEVTSGFKEKDCELLIGEEQYTSGNKNIPYICNKHRDKGIQYATWSNFKRSKIGCGYCVNEIRGKNCRTDFAVIEKAFVNRGYRLLAKPEDYEANTTKLPYICPKHEEQGIQYITWADFNSGCGCSSCGNEKVSDMFRLDFKVVINGFKKRGYVLLSKEKDYATAHTQISYLCPSHLGKGILTITWGDFNDGKGCRYCGAERTGDSRRKDIEYWKDVFREKGCTLLTENIKSSKDKVEFTCNKHPDVIQESAVYHFQEGASCCHICGVEARSGENHHAWKGGITPETRRIRSSTVYKYWKVAVLIRDKRTCQCCGNKKGRELCVHHIKPFSLYPELRTEVSNGMTLCKYCHNAKYVDSFHRVYGYKNNTEAQLYEYLSKRKEELTHAN
jgi:hypothetical protein